MSPEQQQEQTKQAILSGLSVAEDNAVWRAVLLGLEEYTREQNIGAVQRGLEDAARQHQAGIVLGLMEFRVWLQGMWAEAHRPAPAPENPQE